MLKIIKSIAFYGLDTLTVDVEVNISNRGIPNFEIVGLPNKSVDESKYRIKSAIQNSGLEFPNKRITVNLAPADVNKIGSFYDLPIAVGILASHYNISVSSDYLFFGELSLDGTIKITRGLLSAGLHTQYAGLKGIFFGLDGINAVPIPDLNLYVFKNLNNLFHHLDGSNVSSPIIGSDQCPEVPISNGVPLVSLDDIVGQSKAKRLAGILAAGGHHLLVVGPPGVGKTLLSQALGSILPDLSYKDSLEVSKIFSLAGKLDNIYPIITKPQIRSPHHTCSYIGMVGGGSIPKPGEITLAHKGVLFLDELCEFPRQVLEVLRQPLETGYINVSRANYSVVFPAGFTLLAATNPCKCGYRGDSQKSCVCTPSEIKSYQNKISGPLLDRIDLVTQMIRPPEFVLNKLKNERDAVLHIKEGVLIARDRQLKRYENTNIILNRDLCGSQVAKYILLNSSCGKLLQKATDIYKLSPRSVLKIIKTARTIADMADSDNINEDHLVEAIQIKSESVF